MSSSTRLARWDSSIRTRIETMVQYLRKERCHAARWDSSIRTRIETRSHATVQQSGQCPVGTLPSEQGLKLDVVSRQMIMQERPVGTLPSEQGLKPVPEYHLSCPVPPVGTLPSEQGLKLRTYVAETDEDLVPLGLFHQNKD